jgi:hypothetical protein
MLMCPLSLCPVPVCSDRPNKVNLSEDTESKQRGKSKGPQPQEGCVLLRYAKYKPCHLAGMCLASFFQQFLLGHHTQATLSVGNTLKGSRTHVLPYGALS